jgi:hypothetical protein
MLKHLLLHIGTTVKFNSFLMKECKESNYMVRRTDAFTILYLHTFIKVTSINTVLYMVNLHIIESKFCKTALQYLEYFPFEDFTL